MFAENVEKVLSRIKHDDLVLDVGSWACPFNRANWVLDAEPYETRGYYEKIGMPKSQGGEKEYFTKDTWVQRDMCDKEPWPFKDNFFDFSICSHTLEDIRDPLYVCSELIRVSQRGYIEVPSRLIESCRGAESDNIVGLSHHRWLVDIADNYVQFTMKYHMIHDDIQLSFPSSFARKIPPEERISYLFWEDSFTFEETQIHGVNNIYESLRNFVRAKYQYPQHLLINQALKKQLNRASKSIKRKLSI
ncbi:MAG: methionine biosynthesis protein MetW [Coleofasciculaceae cyanobacterium]